MKMIEKSQSATHGGVPSFEDSIRGMGQALRDAQSGTETFPPVHRCLQHFSRMLRLRVSSHTDEAREHKTTIQKLFRQAKRLESQHDLAPELQEELQNVRTRQAAVLGYFSGQQSTASPNAQTMKGRSERK